MKVNFILQGKGGVGKSFIASLLAQYNNEKNIETLCFDTDPVNASFKAYKSLNVKHIALMDKSQQIITKKFDELIIDIIGEDGELSSLDREIIIDNGASSFLPLSNYLVQNDVFSIFNELGIRVDIHTVITGGQALQDTLKGFYEVVDQFDKQVNINVWLNNYFGDIAENGVDFFDIPNVKKRLKHVKNVFNIEHQSQLFSEDVAKMLKNKMIFNDVRESDLFNFMEKNRIKKVKNEIFEQLETMV